MSRRQLHPKVRVSLCDVGGRVCRSTCTCSCAHVVGPRLVSGCLDLAVLCRADRTQGKEDRRGGQAIWVRHRAVWPGAEDAVSVSGGCHRRSPSLPFSPDCVPYVSQSLYISALSHPSLPSRLACSVLGVAGSSTHGAFAASCALAHGAYYTMLCTTPSGLFLFMFT
jgi:hypothetical protein